jgi:hypothetical protein
MAEPVSLEDIIVDQDVQAREKRDGERVALFAALYADKSEVSLPPITLVKTAEGLVLADGFTRVEAARQAGLDSVEAEIRTGTKRDAIVTNIEANAGHGSPLTLHERRRAAERMVSDPAWSKETDRAIARRCGVDNKTVAKLRREKAPATLGKARTVRRAGKTYQMNVSTTERPAPTMTGSSPSTEGTAVAASEEIPQMHRPKGHGGASKLKSLSSKRNNEGAPSAAAVRDKRRVEEFDRLHEIWVTALRQLNSFFALLETVDPIARGQFLKEQPLADKMSEIFRTGSASADPSAAPSPQI